MEDVTPLSDHARVRPSKNKETPSVKSPQNAPPPLPQKRGKDLDHRTEQKLTRGKMHLEGLLDLHGMTQDQAHPALNQFILSAFACKKRCVLVITGKGAGILKKSVPEWLNQTPLTSIVLKSIEAQPKDGGEGALYVYLRRDRS